MKSNRWMLSTVLLSCFIPLCPALAASSVGSDKEPAVPRFSAANMDKTQDPGKDFYRYANGVWLKNNPVPPDKSRWGSFAELEERNNYLIHGILEAACSDSSAPPKSPVRQVGDFYASAMDKSELEKLRFKPIEKDLERIEQIKSPEEMFKVLADLQMKGVSGLFEIDVQPDEKESSIYALQLMQGGLSLPDKDYYLSDSFKAQREAYLAHLKKMFGMLQENPNEAARDAAKVMDIETELARASRSRVDLRDPIKNYNKVKTVDLKAENSSLPWQLYFTERQIKELPYAIVGQPEFFAALNKLIKERPLSDWKTYLRWQVLHNAAPFLHESAEQENFEFFGKNLRGQQEQEPRWKRAEKVIDASIGEALGQLYVEKYFPPEAKERMNQLVNNLRETFKDHLRKLSWMSDATREKAMDKFNRFTQKIGYPAKFRDYSSVEIQRKDYLGNVERSAAFDVQRRFARIGKPVDRSEWHMTPPTVNAYFNPTMNEIVFPAGILQPPFFDMTMDDPVNYGAIGAVIGHEITHGYDDQGRHYDADGNLSEWWTEKDAKEFESRAKKVVEQYNSFEALPGMHVNGELTLGENIADMGGVSIAYDALERALAKDPSKRKNVDGLSPEQRFFLSFAQIWRNNIRDEEAKRRLTIDPHSPGAFRAVGPLQNFKEFYQAFSIKEKDALYRAPEKRAEIW